MKQDLLLELVADARSTLDQMKKHRKALETALVRVQPLLNKYLVEGHDRSACRFNVCMLGPSCKKRGGAELLQELKTLCAGHERAEVLESECLHRCGRGPNVEVGGIVYTNMDKKRAAELVESQLSAKSLNVDLLIDDDFAPEAVVAEDKRCQLQSCHENAVQVHLNLGAQIEALAEGLPSEHKERVSMQVQLMKAMELHASLKSEVSEAEELLKRVVPLDAFVSKIFARKLSAWSKNR